MIPSPIVSCLSTIPGPAEVVTPSEPPNASPSAAPTAAISVLGLERPDAERLVPRELLNDELAGGSDTRPGTG